MSADTIRDFKHTTTEELNYTGEGSIAHTAELLGGILADKGFDPDAVAALSDNNVGGALVSRYFLGDFDARQGHSSGSRENDAATMQRVVLRACGVAPHKDPSYGGAPHENRIITQETYASPSRDGQLRTVRKNGVQRIFRTGLVEVGNVDEGLGLPHVPIAVVGAGAAGILTARLLRECGFGDVHLYDKRGEAGGIWNIDDVRNGSKNNPFDITFDQFVLQSARNTQPEGSGLSIQRFLHGIVSGYDQEPSSARAGGYDYGANADYRSGGLNVKKALVTAIEPGDLHHALRLKVEGQEVTKEYPIVVYAPGLGRPLPLSHQGHMITPATRREAGPRWQKQLSDEKLRELEGKRLVFVGAGNSTAEMVHQLQQYTVRTGRMIDYRILTHYPQQMVYSPSTSFGEYGTLYRDINKPELTSLAGDLSHIGRMLANARADGKVVPGVKKWHVENNTVVAEDRDGVRISIPYDHIYTLTGYGQDPAVLDNMSITCLDEYTGAGAYDFDGEVQRTPGALGRERLYPGYFAVGPAMKDKSNPNAIVIPGIQGQLNNLVTSLVIRASEYARTHPEEMAAYKAARLAAAQTQHRGNSPFKLDPNFKRLGDYDSHAAVQEVVRRMGRIAFPAEDRYRDRE